MMSARAIVFRGKQLFVATCASCHTLASAPKNGGAGSGAMPQQLYQGAQAKQVADDVAAASGGG